MISKECKITISGNTASIDISESGTYFIYVKAHHAKGTIYIQQIDGKKVQRIDDSAPEIGGKQNE